MFIGEVEELIYLKEARDRIAVDLAEQVGQFLSVFTGATDEEVKNFSLNRLKELYGFYKASSDRFVGLADEYARRSWQ